MSETCETNAVVAAAVGAMNHLLLHDAHEVRTRPKARSYRKATYGAESIHGLARGFEQEFVVRHGLRSDCDVLQPRLRYHGLIGAM